MCFYPICISDPVKRIAIPERNRGSRLTRFVRTAGLVGSAVISMILALPLATAIARAQTSDHEICSAVAATINADQTIAACTALLNSGNLSAHDTSAAYNNRGIAYRAKGEQDLAIADYNAALRIDPNDATAYNNRGIAYGAKDEQDLAIADYTAALRINPNYMNAYNNRGIAYRAKGEQDLAIADYTAALRINPNYENAYYNRGVAYRAKGEQDLAIADYTAALRIDPNDATAYNNRGIAYGAKDKQDLAIADYTAALRIDPNDATAYDNRGITYFVTGRFEESASDLESTISLRHSDAYATLWLHMARMRFGGNDADLESRARLLDLTKWPAPVVGLYLGRQTPEQIQTAASTAEDRCEAAFYIGEWQLWHNAAELAHTDFLQALQTCPHYFAEYSGAGAELTRLPPYVQR